ncbi:hypothetical protein VIBNIWn13_1010113 [Vibrio nigripulchritudo Wn13]|nr:hypothetical protein VIBNIWn13_1010113 [Vibrio nigripulchritudo Wn13]
MLSNKNTEVLKLVYIEMGITIPNQ